MGTTATDRLSGSTEVTGEYVMLLSATTASKEVGELDAAGALDGTELVMIVKDGVSKRTTTADLVDTSSLQPLDDALTAISANTTNGLVVATGAGAGVAVRSITGTSGKITVTNGDGVSGNINVNVGSDIAQLTATGQTLSGGARVTTYDNGTKSTGTLTPDPGNGPTQKYTNGGAHTLAPGTNYGSYILDITNNGSAGSITTSGFTKVTGSSFTTTNGHKFKCYVHVSGLGSLLNVQAMQ